MSYSALKLRFDLDDELPEALKEELIEAERLAADEDGEVLVWTGKTASVTANSVRCQCAALSLAATSVAADAHTPTLQRPTASGAN